MRKIGRDIKRMLSGLKYQNAGEFLSMSKKLKTLKINSQKLKLKTAQNEAADQDAETKSADISNTNTSNGDKQ